MNQQIFESHNF